MKIEKKPEGESVEITAHATAQEVDGAFASAYYDFATRMNLRPEKGKTVNQVAQEQLGIKDLDSVVRQTALEALVPLAIDKSGVLPAYPPSVKSTDQLQRGKAAIFTLEMLPKQRYELSSYEPVSITAQPFSVDESLVDKQIAQIAEKNAEYVTAAEQHEVRPGDSILISMRSFQEDGTRIPGLSAASQTYVCGKGFMPESFDREIIGMKPGEEKSFSFDGPDLDPQGNETSMTVDTTVTVLEIQEEKIPEITDEWLARHLPVFKSVADLRADIASKLEAETKKAYDDYLRQLAIAELARRFQGHIPDEAYDAMRDNYFRSLDQQLQAQHMSYDDYVEQQGGKQQFSMMVMMQVREMLVEGYALDALFAHEGLATTDDDYLAAARQINPQAKPEDTRKQLERSGRGFILRETAERYAATEYLLEHADVKIAER